jgi:NHLM bacteriocin system ABC transporter ATP-binding protein
MEPEPQVVPFPSPKPKPGPGREFEVGGNTPLALGAGEVWLVRAGRVEVFAAAADGEGARMHLASAKEGELLLGAEPGSGLGLLAVGQAGTRLAEIDRVRLAELVRRPGGARELAGWIDGWLGRLGTGLALPAAPRQFAELVPGGDVELAEPGRATRGREGIVWVRHLAGETRLWGLDTEPVIPGEPGRPRPRGPEPLPLPEWAWLVGTGEVRLATGSTAELLAEGAWSEIWEGLAHFHALVLARVAAEAEETEQRERERLERKLALDGQVVRSAYARLASVLAPLPAGQAAAEEDAAPLLAACRLVGATQGIAIVPLPEGSRLARRDDLLAALCAASRVRHRRVLLRDDWWRRDNGPLVSFRIDEADPQARHPVALLPTSPRAYEMVDPADGARRPVDPQLADALAGEAYMLYPPLPERPVGVKDLLRAALRDRSRDLGTILWMGFGGGLLALFLPILTGQVFGNVIPGADRPQLLEITLALVVSAVAGAAFQVTRSIAVLRLGGKIDGTVQAAVWDRLLALPVGFFRRFTVGDLANRSLGMDSIRELFTGNVATSILAAVFSLFSFALLFVYSPRLALVATGLVLVLVGTTTLLTWLQLRHLRALYQIQGKVASLLLGLLQGVAKLRVAGAEKRGFALWAHRFAEQRERTIAAQRVAIGQAAFNAVYGVLTSLALFAVVGFTAREEMPLGEFLAFNAAFGQFLASSLSMVAVFSSVLTMIPLYERLSPILTTPPEVDAHKAEPGELAGDIEFSHVSFRYREDGPLILDDVSFRARPGEFVALVGPSGAGKSTCLRLILGFEKPVSGSIYFDGQDVASLAVQSVRRQIGVVLQTGRPMVGDIFSNIVGGSNLTLDDAWEAARMAGLEEDIQAMPMGMHTVISEGAGTFSGGQKQRLLIARAVVHRPRILLFDEATSALDNRTQEVVSRSLERLKATRIVIAHRLSTIQTADRVYVLEGGRVVESGSYAELAGRGGAFTRLIERQIA